jgi:hypothetical protein
MASSVRTDIHRPSAPEFDPESYDFHGCYDLRPEPGFGDGGARMNKINELVRRGYRFAGSAAGTCGHCGAWARYVALLTHHNGTDMMYVGEQCLSNRFEGLSKAQFQALRAAARLNREQLTRRERIAALVDTYPLLADLTYPAITAHYGDFICDIAYKMQRDGQLSERQIAAVCKAVERENGWLIRDAARAAAQAAEQATATPAPHGRVRVTGKVLSTKAQDGDWGTVWKMLVQAVEGYRVWVSIPREIDPDKGQWVAFTATLAAKQSTPGEEADPFFAIGTRPVKGEIIEAPAGFAS